MILVENNLLYFWLFIRIFWQIRNGKRESKESCQFLYLTNFFKKYMRMQNSIPVEIFYTRITFFYTFMWSPYSHAFYTYSHDIFLYMNVIFLHLHAFSHSRMRFPSCYIILSSSNAFYTYSQDIFQSSPNFFKLLRMFFTLLINLFYKINFNLKK